MIEFEIDGQKTEANEGTMIIQAADDLGIPIPRFCYHKKLSIAANCRMCLVHVEKSAKPLPACATPVTPGMKVFTRSDEALAAQRSVMEFLLINHPLDCPICDQGGECELQDLSMGYGSDISRYSEGKRSVLDENLGPLISTEMTRCIQCTRCVRFGTEVAGLPELGTINRGENLEISTYIHHTMRSELSGNIIDLCPVGALTSKPFRFSARAWELLQHSSVSPHDCVGSNLYVHTRGHEYNDYRIVMRVVPRENEALNENWISDRDRFSYEAVRSTDRLLTPKIKREGEWLDVDWDTALNYVVERWQEIIHRDGASELGAIASPSSTIEELFLLQELFRGLGSHNLDHRLRQLDFSQQENFPSQPKLDLPLEEIEHCDTILLIGSDVRREQPLISHRVRKASLQGAKILAINPRDYSRNFELTSNMVTSSGQLLQTLAGVAKCLLPENSLIENVIVTAEQKQMAEYLKGAKRGLVLFGVQAISHPQATQLRALTELLSKHLGFAFGILTEGANATGAWLAGMLPHRGPGGAVLQNKGLNLAAMLTKPLKSYLLLNVEPELDCIQSEQALLAVQAAEFVVMLSPFANELQESYADVFLPIAPFFETAGTFVNVTNDWQSFTAMTPQPLGESKPAWKIFRVLGNLCRLSGFDYAHTGEVLAEIRKRVEGASVNSSQFVLESLKEADAEKGLRRLSEWSMYHIDNLVRRAPALQAWSQEEELFAARINESVAVQYGIQSGEMITVMQNGIALELRALVDNTISGAYILLPGGTLATAGFGEHMAPIEIVSHQGRGSS